MPGWWDRILGRSTTPPQEIGGERFEEFYLAKSCALEEVLGPMHEIVGHAIVPIRAGGNVHMYYYPQTSTGTAFATKDFIEPGGTGPQTSTIGLYEVVSFTRWPYSSFDAQAPTGKPFNRIERRICEIFSMLWFYAKDHALNPLESSEVALGEDGRAAIIFDEYKGKEEFWIEGRKYGLLLCLEVLPTELIFARKHGCAALLAKLKQAGHYPFSDLDRAPVV